MQKIIYAEDLMSLAKLVIFKLKGAGYEVIHFENGEGVVEAVTEQKPSLVITDIMMPVKDGISILKELKANPETADIPVIILTCNNQEESVVLGLESGAAEYIKKPFSTAELLLRVKKILNE